MMLKIIRARNIRVHTCRFFSNSEPYDTREHFQNKEGKGSGMFTSDPDMAASNLIDFIQDRPIKQPKISSKVKQEIKKKVPSYVDVDKLLNESLEINQEDGGPPIPKH